MEYLTTGVIAKRLDVDRDIVSYAIRKLKIKPNSRAGQVRIFSESALVSVEGFIRKNRKDRGGSKKPSGKPDCDSESMNAANEDVR